MIEELGGGAVAVLVSLDRDFKLKYFEISEEDGLGFSSLAEGLKIRIIFEFHKVQIPDGLTAGGRKRVDQRLLQNL